MVLEHHKARHQNGGLQKGGQAQADDLLHPLYKAIHISSGNAEHIQRSNGNLDEQDAAPLQVCEKDLDHRVGHKDDAEQEHDGAGNDAKAKIQRHLRHIRDAFHTAEVCDDLLPHIPDTGPVAGNPGAEPALQRYGQGVEPHGKDGEQADGQEALDGAQRRVLEIGPACGVLNAELKGAHHQAHTIQRPAKLRKKQDNGLYPLQFKDLHPHVAHGGEEVPKEAHDLSVEPVDQVVHDCGGHKVPDKQRKITPLAKGAYRLRRNKNEGRTGGTALI